MENNPTAIILCKIEDKNPFHYSEDTSSTGEKDIPRHTRRAQSQEKDLGIKVEIPDFEGGIHPDEFIEWLRIIDHDFNLKDIPKDLVAIKLKKHACIWWKNVQHQ